MHSHCLDLTDVDEDNFVVTDVVGEAEPSTELTQHILDAQKSLKTVEEQLMVIQQQKEELEKHQVDFSPPSLTH